MRFRACQLVTKLLGNLGEEATIEDALFERVFHSMLERLRDKAAVVRVHAVLALVRLQDPTDDTCPVIKGESCDGLVLLLFLSYPFLLLALSPDFVFVLFFSQS